MESDNQRSQDVLKTVPPNDVAVELQPNGRVYSRRYDDVAILIFDLVEFTAFCGQNNPEKVVETLHT